MKSLCLLLLAFILGHSGFAQKANGEANKSYKSAKLYIKDTTLYPSVFISGLKEEAEFRDDPRMKLVDNILFTSDGSTSIPAFLPLNKKYTLAATAPSKYRLEIVRVSLTEIKFHFLIDDVSASVEASGIGVLDPLFYQGPTNFNDPSTHVPFDAYKYHSFQKDCEIDIFVGNNGEPAGVKGVVYLGSCPEQTSGKLLNPESPVLKDVGSRPKEK